MLHGITGYTIQIASPIRTPTPMNEPVIAVLTIEILVEHSHSLKEKRHVVKSLKDRLRHRFNVAVAEVDGQESWQRSVVAAVTVSNERTRAEQVLQAVEDDSASVLGSMLTSATIEWL
jgi:uncharacterized protein YlxP (DUF503 family)